MLITQGANGLSLIRDTILNAIAYKHKELIARGMWQPS